jgi:hypothetical protein
MDLGIVLGANAGGLLMGYGVRLASRCNIGAIASFAARLAVGRDGARRRLARPRAAPVPGPGGAAARGRRLVAPRTAGIETQAAFRDNAVLVSRRLSRNAAQSGVS